MPFTAAAVANEFLRLARVDEKVITPLKMQKLVYFANGWNLALFGTALIGEPIQAWKFGPVIASLYQAFKDFGSSGIQDEAQVWTARGLKPARLEGEGTSLEVADARAIVAKVWKEYGPYTASRLTTITHSPDAPWSLVPNKDRQGIVIPNHLMTNYFRQQLQY